MLVVLGLVVTACRGGGDGGDDGESVAPIASLAAPDAEVALDFWTPFTGPDGAFMQNLVDQFNEEEADSGITVSMEIVPEYYTELRTAAQSDNLPQVGIMHLDQIPLNAEDGIISPIDDLVDLLDLGPDDFTEAVWNNGEWKDERYGIPLDIHPFVMFWNKAAFTEAGLDPESPPNSEEDFQSALEALHEAGYEGPLWSNHGFGAGNTWATMFYQAGGEWTNEDYTEATFNSEAGVQALDWMKGLVDAGLQPANVEVDAELPAFDTGDSAIIFTGPWQTSRFIGTLADDLGAGPMPQIFGEGVWAGSHNLAVFEGVSADERQAAYYFIDWVTAHATEWSRGGQVPARASVRDSDDFAGVEHMPAVAAQVDAARFFPPIPAADQLLYGAGGANEAVVSVLVGDAESQEALDAAAERFTQIIQDTKEQYGY